jgi:undecaprenyl diphosphate synthase
MDKKMNSKKKIPNCVGIIMDGNRRWAKGKGMPTLEGHRVGGETLKNVVKWARDFGVKNIIFYTFSTENWNRSKDEVSYLLSLIETMMAKHLEEFKKEGGVLHFAGDMSAFSESLQKVLKI